jgi:hypothetical protein
MDQSEAALQCFRAGAVLPVLLGTLHGSLTLLDALAPRFFTPVDDQVRLAMARTSVRLTARMRLWPAWLGFNFSHSLGLVCFGLSLLLISSLQPELVLGFTPLSALAAGASVAYFALAVRFWVHIVAFGAALSFACVATSVLLAPSQ